MEAPTGEAGAYFGALMSSKTLTLVAIVEIVAGLALIFDKFYPNHVKLKYYRKITINI